MDSEGGEENSGDITTYKRPIFFFFFGNSRHVIRGSNQPRLQARGANKCKKNTKEMAVTVWNALCGACDQFSGQDVRPIVVGPKFKPYRHVSRQWYLC